MTIIDVKMAKYVVTHRRIKNKIEERIKNKRCGCIHVNSVAKGLKMDVRTLRKHLELMKIDSYGTYLDDKKQMFCSYNGLDTLKNRARKEIKEEKIDSKNDPPIHVKSMDMVAKHAKVSRRKGTLPSGHRGDLLKVRNGHGGYVPFNTDVH